MHAAHSRPRPPAAAPPTPAPCIGRRRTRRRPRGGFTLIELLAVVTVAGIATAVALPRLRAGKSQVDAGVRQFSLAVMAAQREAVVRQHNVMVAFDTLAGTVRLVWDANNNARLDAGERIRVFPVPDGLVLRRPGGVPEVPGGGSSGQPLPSPWGPALLLQRNGAASAGTMVYVATRASVRGAARDVRALRVERATGQTQWFAWTGSRWRRG